MILVAVKILFSLPKTVIDSDSVTAFKYRLQTNLFSQAFSHRNIVGIYFF